MIRTDENDSVIPRQAMIRRAVMRIGSDVFCRGVSGRVFGGAEGIVDRACRENRQSEMARGGSWMKSCCQRNLRLEYIR